MIGYKCQNEIFYLFWENYYMLYVMDIACHFLIANRWNICSLSGMTYFSYTRQLT